MDRAVWNDDSGVGSYIENSIKTPNFHTLVASGKKLPNNPYLFYRLYADDRRVMTYNGFRAEREARGLDYARAAWTDGRWSGGENKYVENLPSLALAKAIISNRLLEKIRDQEIDLGVSLGEYRETASFVANAMTKTWKSFRSFRRGNVSEALRTLTGRRNDAWRDIPGVASNAWLAYTYGLRPLVSDVYSAMKVLSKPELDTVPVKTVRSGFHQTASFLWQSGSRDVKSQIDYVIKSRGSVTFEVTNPLAKSLDSLGLTNPASVAWELVPFSFVVDWFLPVGKAIQGILPPQGVDFLDGWVSHKCEGKAIQTTDIDPAGPEGWHTRSVSTEWEKSRSVLTSFPRYYVIVPDLSLSKEKIASGLSLLFQVSTWGKKQQVVRPERLSKAAYADSKRNHYGDNRNWKEQWPNDPWWAR